MGMGWLAAAKRSRDLGSLASHLKGDAGFLDWEDEVEAGFAIGLIRREKGFWPSQK